MYFWSLFHFYIDSLYFKFFSFLTLHVCFSSLFGSSSLNKFSIWPFMKMKILKHKELKCQIHTLVLSIVVSIIRYAIRIVLCVKSSVSYWHIVSAHKSYDTVCVLYKSYRIVKSYISYDT